MSTPGYPSCVGKTFRRDIGWLCLGLVLGQQTGRRQAAGMAGVQLASEKGQSFPIVTAAWWTADTAHLHTQKLKSGGGLLERFVDWSSSKCRKKNSTYVSIGLKLTPILSHFKGKKAEKLPNMAPQIIIIPKF